VIASSQFIGPSVGSTENMSRDHYPLLCVTADTENSFLYCCLLARVYRAVAWQRVDQIRYILFTVALRMQNQKFEAKYRNIYAITSLSVKYNAISKNHLLLCKHGWARTETLYIRWLWVRFLCQKHGSRMDCIEPH
jgi:hypothetical protein